MLVLVDCHWTFDSPVVDCHCWFVMVVVVAVELADFEHVMGEKYHMTLMIVAVELVDFEL